MAIWDRCIFITAGTLVVMDAIVWDAPWYANFGKFSRRATLDPGPRDLEKWRIFYWET